MNHFGPKNSGQMMLFAVLLAVCLLALAYPLAAQTFYGTIVGTVTDSTGGVMAGAAVTLTNIGTTESRTQETDASGSYRFVNLIPGNYRVAVEMKGFKRLVREPIVVNVEGVVRIDVSMEVGAVNEVVEVSAQSPLLQTETASLSQVVEGRTVTEMPLNGRNVMNLVALVPGVVPQGAAMTNMTGQNIFMGGNYQIGGGTANQSGTYLDGGPLNVNYGNLTALIPTQDAISEFRVQTNNNSAEYGRFTGGVVNLTSKSGSNGFHGNAYEFIRNKVLNANDFFNNRSGVAKNAFTQNQFGANLGGPIRKDKTFFYFSYEGFRLRQGKPFLLSVPTKAMKNGDFSGVATIYDPTNVVNGVRQPFANNIIPKNQFDSLSSRLLAWPFYPDPNVAGVTTPVNNFATNASVGGGNDQYNIRVDHAISDKQRIFSRYTRWSLNNLAVSPFQNKLYNAGMGPETLLTQQGVIADTYSLNNTTILDVRLSVLRFAYDRSPETQGMDMSTLGYPSSWNALLPYRTLPTIKASGFAEAGGQVRILARNTSYSLVPSLTKMQGRHTLKFGGEVRVLDFDFVQDQFAGGVYTFDNVFTALNPSSPSGSGNAFASFLLGYGASGYLPTVNATAAQMIYQGYYANDTFQATNKLTLNLGIRWELPGAWTERYDRMTIWDPDMESPLAKSAGTSAKGSLALVNSAQWPDRHSSKYRWNLFAPRVGFAYRVNTETVVRAGFGIFYIPADTFFNQSPYYNQVNLYQNTWISTLDNGKTPYYTFSNPFPAGFTQAAGRDPSYQKLTGGQNVNTVLPDQPYGYTQQWNLAFQRQMPQGVAIEAGYAGLRGNHLPGGVRNYNQMNPSYLSLGSALQQQVANPYYGYTVGGPLSTPTVARGQLLRPYPQYGDVVDQGDYSRYSIYHSMQMKAEKRLGAGGTMLAAYTWSKGIGTAETMTAWMEGSSGGVGAVQNYYNYNAERALSSFDARHRLVFSYVVDLPFGKGKKYFNGASGVGGKLISGWGINGVTTLQSGFPLKMTTSTNTSNSFGGGTQRPNVVPNCVSQLGGRAQDRLKTWFNISCFSQPASFTFGTAARVDPHLRAAGINNFDFSVFKSTTITEKIKLQFRAEVFNLFNRVQFAPPGTAYGVAAFGQVSAQANNPRLIQFALRLNF